MGRPGSNQSATKTIPYQKGCRRRPTHADRLRQGPHHHLRKARQESREIPRQGPAVPVHIACAIRAQHGHAGRRGVEHPRRLPAWNAAAGHQKGTFCYACPDVLRDVLNIALDGHRYYTAGKAVLSSCIQLFAILHLPTTHPPPCHMLIFALNPSLLSEFLYISLSAF